MATGMPGTMCESAGVGQAVDLCAYQVGPTLAELRNPAYSKRESNVTPLSIVVHKGVATHSQYL